MQHEFVETIPEDLNEGVLYVSLPYAVVVHRCGCGCGRRVVTPLSPVDWQITYDGESITLYPSIGNWQFPCRSHYWIVGGEVRWAETWSEEQVRAAQGRDRWAKAHYYAERARAARTTSERPEPRRLPWPILKRFRQWWSGLCRGKKT